MIDHKRWISRRGHRRDGWFLFGFIPLYIRIDERTRVR